VFWDANSVTKSIRLEPRPLQNSELLTEYDKIDQSDAQHVKRESFQDSTWRRSIGSQQEKAVFEGISAKLSIPVC